MSTALQERRRRYVAREIAVAAMRLFGEHGFENVTVEEIAKVVGISSRTFFRYYATKDEVVLQYQRRIQERLVDALASRPTEEGPVTALRSAYLATSHVAPEDREAVLLTNRFMTASPALTTRAHGVRTSESQRVIELLAGRMGMDPETDPRPETIAVSMGAAAGAAFQRWIAQGGHGDPAEEIAKALGMLEGGLVQFDVRPPRHRRRRTA